MKPKTKYVHGEFDYKREFFCEDHFHPSVLIPLNFKFVFNYFNFIKHEGN